MKDYLRIEITQQELDTILAALRLWQAQFSLGQPTAFDILTIAEIAKEHGKPLTVAEIDTLCERINS